MQYHHYRQSIALILLVLLAACSNQSQQLVAVQTTSTSVRSASVSTSPTQAVQPVQQTLPKGLLRPGYPVMDWVFNITCSQAINSYNSDQMNTALAYDSAAWLYPSDGHLVEGWQDCDRAALMQQARNQGLPVLLTIGVDSHWSSQDLAQYIDQAASQPQIPCTSQATTFICAIVNWAVDGGYKGVIIDFESVKGDYPNIRMLFATFMRELQDALHQKGLLCGIALIHKVSDLPGGDPSFQVNSFEDWHLLSGIDFLVDMVLDLDLSLNKPGPLVSIPWGEENVDYVWHTVPQVLSKTIFEFPLYGREWQRDAHGSWHPLGDETCQQVNDQKATNSLLPDVSTDSTTPEIAWNDQSGLRHEVWYETPSSLVAVMTHLQQKIRGLLNDSHYILPTSFWYRGAECANFFGQGNALEAFYHSTK